MVLVSLSDYFTEHDNVWNMTQMNLPINQKQTHRHREQTCGCQGGRGVGRRSGSLSLADVNYDT